MEEEEKIIVEDDYNPERDEFSLEKITQTFDEWFWFGQNK